MKYQIQFRGYQPTDVTIPIQCEENNPFENVDMFDANEILTDAVNFGELDEQGWIVGEAAGEEFQVRDIFN